jgi:hypothetical protein
MKRLTLAALMLATIATAPPLFCRFCTLDC